jgi:hypothetical protein
MKKIACFLSLLLSYMHGACQDDSMWRSDYVCHKKIEASGHIFRVVHTFSTSDNLWRRKLIHIYNDEIFDEKFNDFSLLKFFTSDPSFTIPTIPLTHLYLLESKNIVIGLSNNCVSPYNIVIYSTEGKLLFKLSCDIFSIKANLNELKRMVELHPKVTECLKQNPLFQAMY